jgi:uncharacterized membrane protein
MATPSVLQSSGKGFSDSLYISGALVITFSIISAFGVVRRLRSILFLTGIWLLISLWVLNPGSRILAMNTTLTAFVIAILSVIKTKVKERYGGGWSQLIRNRNNAE